MRAFPSAIGAIVLVMSIVVAGCAPHKAPEKADNAVEAIYKSAPNPPRGYARLYVLPIWLTTPWGTHAELAGDVAVGSNESDQVLLGGVAKGSFLAFDIPEGSYYLTAVPYAPASTPSAQRMVFRGGTALIIRPLSYEVSGGNGLLGFLVQPPFQSDKPQFEAQDAAAGMSEIQPLQLLAISPGARAYAEQGKKPQ